MAVARGAQKVTDSVKDTMQTSVKDTEAGAGAELEEAEALLRAARFPGAQAVLRALVQQLRGSGSGSGAAEPLAPPAAPAAPAAPARAHAPPMPNVTPPTSARHPAAPIPALGAATFVPIDSFSWDQGQFDSPTVTVFVDLDCVGDVKDKVQVTFGKHSFDLKVMDLNGRNYRLVNNNLEKDLVPEQCSFLVKRNKVVLKLQKVRGQHSYEHWASLSAKKRRDEADARPSAAADPSAGIMEMMKSMYEDGDENMKRVIGEAMLKSRGDKAGLSAPDL